MSGNNETRNIINDYNLSTNYLHGVQVRSLQDIIISGFIIKAFKSEKVLEELSSQLVVHKQDNENKIYSIVERESKIEGYAYNHFLKGKLVIRLLYNEIKCFLANITEVYKILILRNLVINWQGAIDPEKTFLQVVNNCSFSIKEKFEFSCSYLFDEHIIKTCFNNLSPNDREQYSNSNDPDLLRIFLIKYWIWRCTGQFRIFSASGESYHQNINTDAVFLAAVNFSTETGVQYMYENLKPSQSVLKAAVKHIFKYMPKIKRFNILVYLIPKLNDDDLINMNAFYFLKNIVNNFRWHGIFTDYFKVLSKYVDNNNCFQLLEAVLNLKNMIEIERTREKYYVILREFINLIPKPAMRYIKEEHKIRYVKLIFKLFHFQDVKLIGPLLSNYDDRNFKNIGDNFYYIAKTYFEEFSQAFFSGGNNSNNTVLDNNRKRNFLRVLIRSEEEIFDLEDKLFQRTNPHNLMRVKFSISEVIEYTANYYLSIYRTSEISFRIYNTQFQVFYKGKEIFYV